MHPQRVAKNLSTFVTGARGLLSVVDTVHGVVGPKPLELISSTLNRWTNHMVPVWNPYMPKVCTTVHHMTGEQRILCFRTMHTLCCVSRAVLAGGGATQAASPRAHHRG